MPNGFSGCWSGENGVLRVASHTLLGCQGSNEAVSEMALASRVPSGHGFPAIKNPQPDGMRLASFPAWAA